METPFLASEIGCPFVNKGAVSNRRSQCDADQFNTLALKASQMSRTTAKAILDFGTVASGDATVSMLTSHWGSSPSIYPIVTRSGVGTYTVTFASSLANEYGVSENVVFTWSDAKVSSLSVIGEVQSTESGAVVSLLIKNASGVAADLTAGTKIRVVAG